MRPFASSGGNKYIIVVIDYVSKWVEAQALHNSDARVVMERATKKYGVVHRKEWSYKLDDALWAFRTALKTPLETTPSRLVYGKACHLPIELEHRAYWAFKSCNKDLTKVEANRFLQINKLDELRLDAYESSITYTRRTKWWHDKRIKTPIEFVKGD
ncbi:reverse transcriptase domain-containing protein [Tanacetum coccineum]